MNSPRLNEKAYLTVHDQIIKCLHDHQYVCSCHPKQTQSDPKRVVKIGPNTVPNGSIIMNAHFDPGPNFLETWLERYFNSESAQYKQYIL